MSLNVLKNFPYSKKYYFFHPWEFFQQSYYNIKNFIQRGVKGFCTLDTFDLDSWLLQVLPAALKYLAEHSHGWPSNEKFPEFEDWQEYLFKIAKDLEDCQDCEGNNKNEYYEDYMKQLDDWDHEWEKDGHGNLIYTPKRTEIDEKYFNRLNELSKEQQTLLEDAFARLAKHLYAMWN